nr:MAG TPA: hypothetical protein [Caudoviricetes sp.]
MIFRTLRFSVNWLTSMLALTTALYSLLASMRFFNHS